MVYTDENRGKIQFRARKKQILDFSNLRLKYRITPTDMDGLIEYRNRIRFFIEMKYRNAVPSHGQKLCLTRLADDVEKAGKTGIVLYCWHDVESPEKDVDAAESTVRYIYMKKQWYAGYWRLDEIINHFIDCIEKE